MAKYVGVKLVEAAPMLEGEFLRRKHSGSSLHLDLENGVGREGYRVTYPDGYVSWCPKAVFDDAHLRVGEDNTISEHNINEFILKYDVEQWGDKTTVVHATLSNGFIITESSSCVDPANFNIDIGAAICRERIQSTVWKMLGFLLQTAIKGVKRK